MSIFESPKAKALVDECKRAFNIGQTYLKPHHRTIFVCGGPIDDTRKQRPQFLEFAKTHLPDYQVLIAEAVSTELRDNIITRWEDVASFEARLSNLSDCILLFPESAGSIAELGYFSAKTKLKNLVFVVNPYEHQGDSFINLGPISIIEKATPFKKIIIQKNQNSWDFNPIKDRLERNIPKKNSHHISPNYKLLKAKEKLYLTLFLIEIFGGLDSKSLLAAFVSIFGNGNYLTEIRLNLGVLFTCKYIVKSLTSPVIYVKNTEKNSLVEIRGFDSDAFRLKAMELLQTEHIGIFERVMELNNAL